MTNRCGSSTGYSEHWRLGTEPCTACRAARARHQADYMKRRILNGGDRLLVDPTGTRRRIEALMWMGYSQGDLGARLGVADTQVRLLCIRKRIFRESAEKIAALFEELCMTAGPSVRARNYARRQGYAPPLAWLDIDDPREVSLTEIERDHAEAREINRRRLHQEWKRARRAAA